MPNVFFQGAAYALEPGETVLSGLRRQGVRLASSCESGVCQTCMMKALSGSVPERATNGLKETQREQGCFLACVCVPESDIEVVETDDARTIGASIVSTIPLNNSVLRVRIRTDTPVEYRAGQFMNLVRPDGLSRSYSVASVSGMDKDLEFHVALLQGGRMSGWLHAEARPADRLELVGPLGTCYYTLAELDRPMLLAGTGTGLAPLYGIARDALRQGHHGTIHLFHGSLAQSGLYLVEELRGLEGAHPNFHYHPCALNGPADEGIHVGAIDAFINATVPNLKGYRVFLCGHPDTVKLLQKKAFLAGANMKDISADAFLPSVAVVA